ncbi:MAG: metal ABC transporter substrate-binding protein [Hyphomicrobiales bacterium]
MRMLVKYLSLAFMIVMGSTTTHAAEKLKIITSFSILADITKAIGGDAIDVTCLVEPDADLHHFEPRPHDIKNLLEADLVIVNGLGFEPWLDRVKPSIKRPPLWTIASEGITPLPFDHHDHEDHGASEGEAVDPHAWQNVSHARLYAKNIATALINKDPDHRALYLENLARYDSDLERLDRDIRNAIAKIPPEKRKIVTSHDAFGYFEKAYGLKMIAPLGVGRESQPSAKDMARIIRQIRDEAIPAIFLETAIDPRLAEQLASETGVKIGGTLYADMLSQKNGPAGTYITMMETNIRTLTDALTR